MSDKKAKKPKGGQELYCVDKDGKKQDSGFHREILMEGDRKRARSVSRALAKELGLSHVFGSAAKSAGK